MPMTISIDDDLKNDFAAVCKEIGLSPSTAFTIFAKAVVREKGIPFRLTAIDAPAAQTQSERDYVCRNYEEHLWRDIEQARREIEAGHYCTLEELDAKREQMHQKATRM